MDFGIGTHPAVQSMTLTSKKITVLSIMRQDLSIYTGGSSHANPGETGFLVYPTADVCLDWGNFRIDYVVVYVCCEGFFFFKSVHKFFSKVEVF